MFKKLTLADQLRIERGKNLELLNKQTLLEEALLEATMVMAEEQAKNALNEQAIIELSMLIGGDA